jgi:hypothetical protein
MRTIVDQLDIEFSVNNSQLNAGVKQAETKIDGFARRTSNNLNKLAAVWAATFAIRGLVDVITQFEKLEASLRTVTGSAELAAKRFSALQEFAATTPFQLTEVVDAFIKLRALGLTPSEDALRSFGNTAIAMGKSLNQFIEAVADATTGEFERLKEFGIKARVQGEQVKFTFQGVTTEVGKNAVEIENFLRGIGNVQFAGAMKEQADTLNVALSNLEDSFNKLVKEIGDAGLTDTLVFLADTLKGVVELAQQSVKGFRFMGLAVQEFGANINSVILDLLGFDEASKKSLEDARAFVEEMRALNQDGGALPEDQVGAASIIPSNEELLKDLDKFRESLMTKLEIENEHFEERIEALQEFKDSELITNQEFNDLLEKEEMRHRLEVSKITKDGYADRLKFEKASNKDKAKTIFNELDNITAGVSQHNRALFEINKVSGIANAIISTYEAINKTLAAYPAPFNYAMAAGVAAAGFAQVNAIRSTQFGGGGSGAAPSVSGSTAAAPVSDVGSSGGGGGNNLDVRLSGISADSLFSGSQITGLIAQINEAVEDGAIIRSVSVAT